jgi:hypothetical protein
MIYQMVLHRPVELAGLCGWKKIGRRKVWFLLGYFAIFVVKRGGKSW